MKSTSRIVTLVYVVLMVLVIFTFNRDSSHHGAPGEGMHEQEGVSAPAGDGHEIAEAVPEGPSELETALEAIINVDYRQPLPHDDPENPLAGKPFPDLAIAKLQQGNARFVRGTPEHPRQDAARLKLAAIENQGDHAYATVIACSDSRVPVELIFDAGIMDIFVIRVAGNVCDVDERGSIEYGLAHVRTPVLVVLGHTQCGAVTAVTHALQGHGHALERNIPDLVADIQPAVKRAMEKYPDLEGDAVIPVAIEENVWNSIESLFMESPVTRELVQKGYVKVVGALYDVGTGKVSWLPEDTTLEILEKVEADPEKVPMSEKMASGHQEAAEKAEDLDEELPEAAPKEDAHTHDA